MFCESLDSIQLFFTEVYEKENMKNFRVTLIYATIAFHDKYDDITSEFSWEKSQKRHL